MDDLVERLDVEHTRNGGQGAYAWQARELCGKAAAEIRSLRAEVQRLTYDGIHTCHDACPRLPCVQRREIEALTAENAKLRKALEYIVWYHGKGHRVTEIARAALETDNG
jgi:hypothetical protein